MLFAATTFWLIIVLLLAWGVHHIWCSIAKPKRVNVVLLPGTLIAQLGRIVALLVTGAKVNNTSLMKNDGSGEPENDPQPEPKIPVIGPVVVALLPMLALGLMIYLVIIQLGMPVVVTIPQDQIAKTLPTSAAPFWNQLRDLITLAEGTMAGLRTAHQDPWKLAIFIYLMTCLTVRLAPFRGNIRGHLGAIVTVGVAAWVLASVSEHPLSLIDKGWPLLTLTIGWLLLLLIVSLVARGAVSACQLVLKWDA